MSPITQVRQKSMTLSEPNAPNAECFSISHEHYLGNEAPRAHRVVLLSCCSLLQDYNNAFTILGSSTPRLSRRKRFDYHKGKHTIRVTIDASNGLFPAKARGDTPLESIDILDTPKEILGKILSLKYITADISFSLVHHCERIQSVAWRERAAKTPPWSITVTERHCQPELRAIGWESCGIVYEQHGTSHVLKRAINNGALAENCGLWKDLIVHTQDGRRSF